jgi:hypothetical protein
LRVREVRARAKKKKGTGNSSASALISGIVASQDLDWDGFVSCRWCDLVLEQGEDCCSLGIFASGQDGNSYSLGCKGVMGRRQGRGGFTLGDALVWDVHKAGDTTESGLGEKVGQALMIRRHQVQFLEPDALADVRPP